MARDRPGRKRLTRLRTIRAALLLLILTAILPTIALVVLGSLDQYRNQRQAEIQASVDVARAVAASFDSFVLDLARTEYVLGISAAAHRHSVAEIQAELEAVRGELRTVRALSFVDAEGRIIASTDPRLTGTSIFAREYFQELARGKAWTVSNLIHSLADGAPVFVVARAVAFADAPTGVVVATVDPDRLASIIGVRGGAGAAGIIDAAGMLVVNQPPPPDTTWEGRRRTIGHPLLLEARAGRDPQGIFDSPIWGTRRIGAVVPVSSAPGWVAIASRPVAEAMAPVWRGIAVRAVAALAVAVAALLTALWLSRRIAVPLRQLELHAADVARGEHRTATVRGPAEVEQVAQAINDMSEMLAARRREAEDAMRSALEQRSELDAVFATAPVGLLHLDTDPARPPRMNAAARQILGLPADVGPFDTYLRTVSVSRPGSGVVAARDLPLPRALRGEPTHEELLHLEPLPGHPGRACWLSVSAAPVRGPEGEVVGAVAAFVDVTALRELQDERETLMQMVSHDLRTPLHVVVGHAQLLRRGSADHETVARRADAILASSARMQRLIQDMVDATRLEAGHVGLSVEPVEVGRFLHEWKERLAGALAVERVRIAAPEETPLVLADPARLEQIVVNLVTNALKYSAPESEVAVTLAVDGPRMELSVRDRGPGIPPDEIPRLFERYYRARNATRAEGLGLGLFITRKLVEAHGWSIGVESELGRGSTFTVVIPVPPTSTRRKTAAA